MSPLDKMMLEERHVSLVRCNVKYKSTLSNVHQENSPTPFVSCSTGLTGIEVETLLRNFPEEKKYFRDLDFLYGLEAHPPMTTRYDVYILKFIKGLAYANTGTSKDY